MPVCPKRLVAFGDQCTFAVFAWILRLERRLLLLLLFGAKQTPVGRGVIDFPVRDHQFWLPSTKIRDFDFERQKSSASSTLASNFQ